jgi:hypothetical protein
VSILNLHEDERQKPENWIPIGWMPNYDKDLTKRPGRGYESDQARKVRLFHDCFRHLLRNWDDQTKTTQNRLNPAAEPLVDPSSDCIDVTLLLLTWYRLFRRSDPPKDEEDINELQELAHRYLNLSENI